MANPAPRVSVLRTSQCKREMRDRATFAAMLGVSCNSAARRCFVCAIAATDATPASRLIQLCKTFQRRRWSSTSLTKVSVNAAEKRCIRRCVNSADAHASSELRECFISARAASRVAGENLHRDALRACRARASSCIPSAPGAAATSEWILCDPQTVIRSACRDRRPG